MNLSFQDQEVAQASGQGPASKCLRAALSLGLPDFQVSQNSCSCDSARQSMFAEINVLSNIDIEFLSFYISICMNSMGHMSVGISNRLRLQEDHQVVDIIN